MEIKKSKNYEQFKLVKENRVVDNTHVRKIMASIQKQNLLMVNPIIVDKEFNVIDGQHRLTACKNLGIDVYYIVLDNPNINQNIIDLQISKNWNFEDYLKHYLKLGIFEYRVINELYIKYKLSISTLVELVVIAKSPTKDFKNGSIKLKSNIKEYYKMLEALMDFKEIDQKYISKKQFVRAFAVMYLNKEYNHQSMLNNMQLLQDRFQVRATVEETLRALENIYNYKKSKKIRFY